MKGLKKLGTLACVGATVLSMTAPVLANDTTNVSYTPGAFNIDNDGKVLMVVPKSVDFNEQLTEASRTLTIKTADPNMVFDNAFTVAIKVKSDNGGKLKDPDISEPADVISYTLHYGDNAGNTSTNVPLTTTPTVITTLRGVGSQQSVTKHLKFTATDKKEEMEIKYDSEKTFTDVLTFSADISAGGVVPSVQP